MNVLVHKAVTDVTGKTGMAIIEAILRGERNPLVLASFRDCRCKKDEQEIAKALAGDFRHEHLFCTQTGLRVMVPHPSGRWLNPTRKSRSYWEHLTVRPKNH